MEEGAWLVNDGDPRRLQGRIFAPTLKLGRAKGRTRALLRAALMQASAGVPEAGPDTETDCTLPSEPKVTVAAEAASCPATQARAPRRRKRARVRPLSRQ